MTTRVEAGGKPKARTKAGAGSVAGARAMADSYAAALEALLAEGTDEESPRLRSDFDDAPPDIAVPDGLDQSDPDQPTPKIQVGRGLIRRPVIRISVSPGGDLLAQVAVSPEFVRLALADAKVAAVLDHMGRLGEALMELQPRALQTQTIPEAFLALDPIPQARLAERMGVNQSWLSRQRHQNISCRFGTVPVVFFWSSNSIGDGAGGNRAAKAIVAYVRERDGGASQQEAVAVAAGVAQLKPDSFRRSHVAAIETIREQRVHVEVHRARFPRGREIDHDVDELADVLGIGSRGRTAVRLALLGVI